MSIEKLEEDTFWDCDSGYVSHLLLIHGNEVCYWHKHMGLTTESIKEFISGHTFKEKDKRSEIMCSTCKEVTEQYKWDREQYDGWIGYSCPECEIEVDSRCLFKRNILNGEI